MKKNKSLVSGALAFGLILGLAACAETVTPDKTPQQVWIETHPTTLNSDGECIEFDGEPCDDDPFDLDDMKNYPYLLPSPKPVIKTTRPVVPPKASALVKTTKRR